MIAVQLSSSVCANVIPFSMEQVFKISRSTKLTTDVGPDDVHLLPRLHSRMRLLPFLMHLYA